MNPLKKIKIRQDFFLNFQFDIHIVRWPTTVTAKEITSRQKKKTHDKRKNLTAKEKDSRQKKKTHDKRKNLTAKEP